MRCILFLILLVLVPGCTPAAKSTGKDTESGGDLPAAHSPTAPQSQVEEGFQAITLQDLIPFHGDEKTWSEQDGLLVCSGTPKGYAYTKKTFGNLTFRGDFAYELTEEQRQHPEKANTGFMIAIQEPHKVWPPSLEVQGRMDEVCSIKSNGGIPALTIEDHPDVREKARKPAGEWNTVEIVVRNGAITATLNGELVCTSAAGELKEGLLGLQSEGFVVKFRNLRVRRDPAE